MKPFHVAINRFISAALLAIASSISAYSEAGTVTYVYTDPQGTTLTEADQNGTVVAQFDYRPYGSAYAGQGMTAPQNGPGYTGHVNDSDTAFVYMQARYYDPAIARFLSVDPAGPQEGAVFSFNRYNYVNNNPIVHVDPDGRYTCTQNGKTVSCQDSGVTKLVNGIRSAQSSYARGSTEYIAISRLLAKAGSSDTKSDITFNIANTGGQAAGGAGKGGVINLDMKQLAAVGSRHDYQAANPGKSAEAISSAVGSAAVGHELQHEIDYDRGSYPTNRNDEHATERHAVGAEWIIGKGLGVNMGLDTQQDREDAANRSTNLWCSGNPTAGGCN